MTTTNPGRAGDPTAQAPEGLRKLIADALTEPCGPCGATGRIVGRAGEMPCVDCYGEGRVYLPEDDMADAVLAALFAACEVRQAFCTRYTDRYHGSSDYPAASAEEALAAAKRAIDYVDATAMRWLVIETEPEPIPVVSDDKEATDAP